MVRRVKKEAERSLDTQSKTVGREERYSAANWKGIRFFAGSRRMTSGDMPTEEPGQAELQDPMFLMYSYKVGRGVARRTRQG